MKKLITILCLFFVCTSLMAQGFKGRHRRLPYLQHIGTSGDADSLWIWKPLSTRGGISFVGATTFVGAATFSSTATFNGTATFNADLLVSTEVAEGASYFDADGDSLFINPIGFSNTNSNAAGTSVLQYKDGANNLFLLDSLGTVTIAGSTTLGDATADVVTLNGTLTSNQTYATAATIFYFRSVLTATSGEHNNLRGRAMNQAVGASTSDIRGVYGQATTTASLYGGTGTGVFANFIAKNLSTTVTGRALFAEAETEATPTAITNLYTGYFRTKAHRAPSGEYYNILLESEKVATGFPMDAYLGMKSTTWGAAENSAAYGIDMNGVTALTTADIRGHNGEIIFNDPDGTWSLGSADLKVNKIHNDDNAQFVLESDGDVNVLNGVVFVDSSASKMGINESSPDQDLEIAGSVPAIHIDASDNAHIYLDKGGANKRGTIHFQTAGAAADWIVGLTDSDNDVGDGTDFFIGNATGGATPAVYIDKTNFYFGLGVTDVLPSARFYLDGSKTTDNLAEFINDDDGAIGDSSAYVDKLGIGIFPQVTVGSDAANVDGQFNLIASDADAADIAINTSDQMLFQNASGGYVFDDFVARSVTAGITATNPGVQGDSPLTTDINEVSTVGAGSDAVTLPTAAAGLEIFIINNGANVLEIFPASSDNLGAGVDTATTLASGANITFVAYDGTNWEVK